MSGRNRNTETLKHRNTVLGFLVICAVVAFWFSPWWAGGRVLAPLDVLNEMMQPWRAEAEAPEVKNHMVVDSVTQYLGYRLYAEDQLRSEGRIGWSDLKYGGTPAYANTMALFDDWTMQLHRWFEFWTAWHLGLIGQVILAAVGMFLFLKGRTIGVLLALAGAIAWAANSQFVCWVNHRWALSAFCWLPWVFLAMDRFRAGERKWALMVPGFLALSFLGGTLQHAGLIVLCVVGYWLAEEKGWAWRRRLSGVGKYMLWGLGGMGLAAFMFFPQIEAFRISSGLGLHTGMFQGLEDGLYPEGSLQPLFHLASYPLQIFPSLLGSCDSVDVLKLFKSELFYVAYFGSMPVLLAFMGLFRRDTPPLAKWLMVMGLILPLTPLVRVLYQRLFLLFIFGGILAFAHFVQHTNLEDRKRVFRWVAGAALLAVVGWLGLSLFLSTAGAGWMDKAAEVIRERGASSTFGYFDDWISARADRFLSRVMIWSPWQLVSLGLFGLGLAGFRISASVTSSSRQMGMLLMTLAVVGEVTVFAQRWVTWSDPSEHSLYADTAEVRELNDRMGDGRVKNLISPQAHLPNTPLMANTLVPYGLATIDGYDSIVPNGMALPGDPELDAKVLALRGVSHLIAPITIEMDQPGWREVWASASTRIYENQVEAPRYAGFTSRKKLSAYVDGKLVQAPISVSETTGRQNDRLIEVPDGVEWVRVAENHVEGWEWQMIGESDGWVPADRANDGSLVIGPVEGVQQSDRMIRMRFQPTSRRIGTYVSFATLGLLGLVGLGGSRYFRKSYGN